MRNISYLYFVLPLKYFPKPPFQYHSKADTASICLLSFHFKLIRNRKNLVSAFLYINQARRSEIIFQYLLMQDNFMDSEPLDRYQISHLYQVGEESLQSEGFQYLIADNPTTQQKSSLTLKQMINCSFKKKRTKSKNKMIRRITKTKTQKESSYKKNICGYITKKVIREFIYGNYKKNVKDLCENEHVEMKDAQDFYESKIETVTGPSHLPSLFTTSKFSQLPILRVFVRFFQWFLKERYVRHLFLEGKMEIKKAYIEYKNNKLLQIVAGYQKSLFDERWSLSTLNVPGQSGNISQIQLNESKF